MADPIISTIQFPYALDNWESLYDFGTAPGYDSYTKLYAGRFNKVRNLIDVVQFNLVTASASGDNSLNTIAYTYHLPPISMNEILAFSSLGALNQGKSPASHVIPFECVITSNTDVNYNNWTSNVSRKNMIYIDHPNTINYALGYFNRIDNYPLVSGSLYSDDETLDLTRWAVNVHAIPSSGCLLIRGSLIDIRISGLGATLPNLSTIFSGDTRVYLRVTLTGVG